MSISTASTWLNAHMTAPESPSHSSMQRARACVARGALVLDGYFLGRDWVNRIDPDRLNMRHPSECILGQLFGEYATGVQKLPVGLRDDQYGFDATHTHSEYAALERAWLEVIREQRG